MTNLKKPAICIVDYRMGNLRSVGNAIRFLGVVPQITNNINDLQKADVIVLPGVGSFGEATKNLHQLDLIAPLTDLVIGAKKPFLGICLGMQLLGENSPEHGFHKGLNWLEGQVQPFPKSLQMRVPHVGWQEVCGTTDELFRDIPSTACFYFDHSYYLNANEENVVARCLTEVPFVAAIRKDNIFATQFHPEKSQYWGAKLLHNFLKLASIGLPPIEYA